ncbi:hypothetical protein BOTCAL_0234g00120 [Botryotinia calthae]|uniref:Cytochrome b561 domain-containing protein n=1 Tax=Botryotinia calthae TaxID=38488 RepID=A0A4Y8CZP9_9HELO|nr:hypothetical protein BOTCAL_0234g00120 [Botryotinia calthae]
MATDDLSPPGSSTYSSSTMYVGDGTWDATKNDFLLPNLMGLNFETMRYNGMGNRFATMPGYKGLITAHGVIAAITFLFIVPAAVFIARFYGRDIRHAIRYHIYLQIMTLLLSTVIFILGWMAVGNARSLTNPHHGIGLAIYVLIWVQFLSGWLTHNSEKKRVLRRIPLKAVLHQWIGRVTALLAIAQVPLGLTLYGSPKYLFILFAVWMGFLVLLYFILSYRALQALPEVLREGSRHGEVIQERRKSSFGIGILGPLLAGAGAAALLGDRDRKRSRSRSRSRSHSRIREVIPSRRGSRSRRGSVSYVEEEKYESRKKEGGGVMNSLFKGAAVLGAGALAKSFFDRRQRTKPEDEYSSVAPDTPGRRQHRRNDSEYSDSTLTTERTDRYESRSVLPGPGAPVAAAAAISAAKARPTTPRPVTPVTPRPVRSQAGRAHSFDSMSYSYDYGSGTTASPSRRPQENNGLRNGLLASLGIGWFTKKTKDRREKKEMDRIEREEDERYERERASRHINQGSHLTSDAFPPRPHIGQSSIESSELSSLVDPYPAPRATVSVPAPVPVNMGQSRSHHDVVTETVSMPPMPTDPHGVLHQPSDSDVTQTPGRSRRRSSIRREEGEAAAAAAAAGAAGLAAEEERRRQRSHSRSAVASPPVSVKVKMHGDKDRNVTLRRLTEQEAAAERASRRARSGQRRSRRDSASDFSEGEVSSRYRREAEKRSERRAESVVRDKREEAGIPPPPIGPLTPPNPAFAGGKKPKDSGYYSGQPQSAGKLDPSVAGGSILDAGRSNMSEDTHGTWSAMSPNSGTDHARERRQRRRMERQRQSVGAGTAGTVDFT